MIKSIPFVKMHTLGNDFVILDRLENSFYLDSHFVKTISHRKFGIGFDQLLVLEAPVTTDHDFSFQVFNFNGQSAKQCLNGARALISYIIGERLVSTKTVKLQISDQSIEGEQISTTVFKTVMCNKMDTFTIESLGIDSLQGRVDLVYCGNQHLIAWDIDSRHKNSVLHDLKKHGYTFDKYNISFARKVNDKVTLETMERGVGKTLSCGSAALSTFISYSNHEKDVDHLKIETSSGYITAGKANNNYFLTGPTTKVFSGEFTVRYKSNDRKKHTEQP